MIELHPKIVNKDGKPESVVLPYEEYMKVQEALQHLAGNSPQPDPRYGGYWDNLSAEELAKRQGVGPTERVEGLYGNGDPSDWVGFDDALEQWRAEHPVT